MIPPRIYAQLYVNLGLIAKFEVLALTFGSWAERASPDRAYQKPELRISRLCNILV